MNPRLHLGTKTRTQEGGRDTPLPRDMPLRETQPEEDPATLPSQDARDIPEVKTGHVLFTLQNVKVSATLGVGPQSSRAYYPVLDTGAGPNIIRKDTLL